MPPDAPPYTTPEFATTVAMEVLVQLQVPPGVASLNVVEPPWHKDNAPMMGAIGLMVTDVVT